MKGSHVFTTLGHRSYRRRTVILVGSALVIVVIAIVGLSVFPRLGSEGFNDPASDSEQVAQILEEQFGTPESNMFSRWLIRNRMARIRSIPRRQREWGALSRGARREVRLSHHLRSDRLPRMGVPSGAPVLARLGPREYEEP